MWPLAALANHSLPEKRFSTLPGGADMHVAIRRCTRLGEKEGLPIEESGVEPDRRHFLTKRDLLQYDADLMIKVGRILTAQNLSASADQSV